LRGRGNQITIFPKKKTFGKEGYRRGRGKPDQMRKGGYCIEEKQRKDKLDTKMNYNETKAGRGGVCYNEKGSNGRYILREGWKGSIARRKTGSKDESNKSRENQR